MQKSVSNAGVRVVFAFLFSPLLVGLMLYVTMLILFDVYEANYTLFVILFYGYGMMVIFGLPYYFLILRKLDVIKLHHTLMLGPFSAIFLVIVSSIFILLSNNPNTLIYSSFWYYVFVYVFYSSILAVVFHIIAFHQKNKM